MGKGYQTSVETTRVRVDRREAYIVNALQL